MSVGEICNRDVVTVSKDATIHAAVKLMRERGIGTVLVVDRTDKALKPVGILTDRDIVIEVLAEEIDPRAVIVSDIMSPELVTVRESEETSDVLEIMAHHGVRRVPVLDRRGNLVGILSMDDVIDLVAEQLDGLSLLLQRGRDREQRRRRPIGLN
ncbi:MAG: CBS domain-containing protein [Gammaproteobacteria bacterium]|jgi:CBS domain-containing protein